MSWFDAASFTSYAKTALASAQKSIDKVLDIDDGATGSSSQATPTVKGKGKEVEKSLPLKTSTPKATNSSAKHSLSKEKHRNQNDSFEDKSGDFWSSFLGNSDSSSEEHKTPAKKSSKGKEPLGRKISDPRPNNEKQKQKSGNVNFEKEMKREDYLKENENSNLLEKTQDSLNKTKGKSRKVKSEKVASVYVKASSERPKLQSNMGQSGHSDSHEAGSKHSMNESTANDPTFVDVSLEQDNPQGGVENVGKAFNLNTNLSKVKDVTSEREIGKENQPGSMDDDIEDGGLERITITGLMNESEQSLMPLESSAMSKNKDLTSETLTSSEEVYEGNVNVQNSDEVVKLQSNSAGSTDAGLTNICNAEGRSLASNTLTDMAGLPVKNDTEDVVEESSTNEETTDCNARTVDEELSKSNASNATEELTDCNTSNATEKLLNSNASNVRSQQMVDCNTSNATEKIILNSNASNVRSQQMVDCNTSNAMEELTDCNTDKIEDTSYFEETTANQSSDHCKQPSEDDCGTEAIQGQIVMSKYVLQEKSTTSCDHQTSSTRENIEDRASGRDTTELSVRLLNNGSVGDLIKQELMEIETQKASEVQELMKELSDLKELVNARESKMVSLSKENIDYQETNAILRSQIEQLETINAGDNEEFEELKEEFTTRIAEAENKHHEAANQRDKLRTDLEEQTAHLTEINSRQKEEYTILIAEKDEQIAQLLAEGEKLSKQELQSNTVIKRLRAKEKESDALIKKQTKKIEEYEEEVKRLTDILMSRDDSNSKQEDAIIKLNTYVKKQEEQLSKQTSDLEDANEKVRSMQVALDNAYKEMTALQKQTATADSTIQEAVLSTEMKAKEELRMALERSRREFQQESEMMALQVADLQSNLTRAEQQSTRREENLRQEVKHLQQRLQEAEDRNQELAASVSHATRPLLRQIENLQTTHNGQALTWEKVEKNLTERLNEAQNQLLIAQEKEHIASHNVSELNARISRLESQVNTYRAERSRFEAELELERTKTGTLEDEQSRESAKYNAMVKKYQKLIEDANLDKAHLEQQLTVEKSKMDTQLMKLKATLEEKEKIISHHTSFSGVQPSPLPASGESSDQRELDTMTTRHTRTSSSSGSVMDGIPKGILGGTTALVERLQAQVRQKDGEIELLQDDVTSLQQSRDSVMEELTSLTEKVERLETSHEKYKELKEKYDALQQRYNAVLQMYGEKEEEAEELRMDLQDVKSMYKQQLEQLFGSKR